MPPCCAGHQTCNQLRILDVGGKIGWISTMLSGQMSLVLAFQRMWHDLAGDDLLREQGRSVFQAQHLHEKVRMSEHILSEEKDDYCT
jgi:hypothetical protein